MDIEIDPEFGDTAVRAAAVRARRRINAGELIVGAKLPTVRALAVDLGLAANTVARAYRELEAAGLLETRGRAGTFVGASGDRSRERARHAAADYATTARQLGLSRDEALAIVAAALD